MADELFDSRLTEHRNPRTREIDLASPVEIVDLINAEDRLVPEAVHSQRREIAMAIEIAVECFKAGGRLIYVGAGTSGRLGVLDATECPPTFGTDPELVHGIVAGGYIALVRSQEGAEDRAADGAAALEDANVSSSDFVFGIATSSTTPFVRGALQHAAARGARTGFLCCTEPGDEIRSLVDVCIVPLVGPEVIAGSTRMKAGTATKLVLNTVSTGAMIRLGKVYGNLMVDLRATSEKLIDRSQRIVMAATGCGREEALALINAAGGSVKIAIVMRQAGLGRELAELHLAESSGFVRGALQLAEAPSGAGDDPYVSYPAAPPNGASLELTLAAVRSLPRQVFKLLSGVPERVLRARPSDRTWSVKEQIAHLIDADEVMNGRIAAILAGTDPEVANRDDETENRKIFDSGARDLPTSVLLRKLGDGRTAISARVEALSPEQFARPGRHELYGSISVYQILRHLVWHDHHHVEAIRRLVSG